MTVEQVLRVLEKCRADRLAAADQAREQIIAFPPSAQDREGKAAVLLEEDAEAISRAIDIVKAAQDVVDIAFAENVTPRLWQKQVYVYKVFEKPMDRLIFLISPEQVQKKKEEA